MDGVGPMTNDEARAVLIALDRVNERIEKHKELIDNFLATKTALEHPGLEGEYAGLVLAQRCIKEESADIAERIGLKLGEE